MREWMCSRTCCVQLVLYALLLLAGCVFICDKRVPISVSWEIGIWSLPPDAWVIKRDRHARIQDGLGQRDKRCSICILHGMFSQWLSMLVMIAFVRRVSSGHCCRRIGFRIAPLQPVPPTMTKI